MTSGKKPLVLFVDADESLRARFAKRFEETMSEDGDVFARVITCDQHEALAVIGSREIAALVVDLLMPPPWVPIPFLLGAEGLVSRGRWLRRLRPLDKMLLGAMRRMILPSFRFLVLLSRVGNTLGVRLGRTPTMHTGFGGFDLLFRLANSTFAGTLFSDQRVFVYSYLIHPAAKAFRIPGEILKEEMQREFATIGAGRVRETPPRGRGNVRTVELPSSRFYAGPSSIDSKLDEEATGEWRRLVEDLRARVAGVTRG